MASSNRIIGDFLRLLTIDNLCFSPPDNLIPFSPIIVSYLLGNFSINSYANEYLAASRISCSVALEFAYRILFFIVSSKRVVSWLTSEIFLRSEKIFVSLTD